MADQLTTNEVREMARDGSYLKVAKAIAAEYDLDTGIMYLITAALGAAELNGFEKATKRMAETMLELQTEAHRRAMDNRR